MGENETEGRAKMTERRIERIVVVVALAAWALPALCQGPPPDRARRKALIEKFDADGDGRLSPSEMAKSRPEGRPGHVPHLRKQVTVDGDAENAGKSGFRHDAEMQALLETFDANDDGKLSSVEMEALRKARPVREETP